VTLVDRRQIGAQIEQGDRAVTARSDEEVSRGAHADQVGMTFDPGPRHSNIMLRIPDTDITISTAVCNPLSAGNEPETNNRTMAEVDACCDTHREAFEEKRVSVNRRDCESSDR